MRCASSLGASTRHRYKQYRKLFSSKIYYKCIDCGFKLTEAQFMKYEELYNERYRLLIAMRGLR